MHPKTLKLICTLIVALNLMGCNTAQKHSLGDLPQTKDIPQNECGINYENIDIIAITEFDPWDARNRPEFSPVFILKKDEEIISRNKDYQLLSSENETKQIYQDVKNTGLFNKHHNLKNIYELSKATDQIETKLIILDDNKCKKTIHIYGKINKDSLPNELFEAIQIMKNYQSSDSKPWKTNLIALNIWPYKDWQENNKNSTDTEEKTIEWDSGLPDLTAQKNLICLGSDNFILYIDSEKKQTLQRIFNSKTSGGPIEINQKLWRANYREAVPYENLWLWDNKCLEKHSVE
jgi:hypothetical protein